MEILQAVLPVFLVIAIGATARRFRFIGEPFIDTANRLVYYFLLPALLFYKIGTVITSYSIHYTKLYEQGTWQLSPRTRR